LWKPGVQKTERIILAGEIVSLRRKERAEGLRDVQEGAVGRSRRYDVDH
jgi:hypothetical protein